MTEDQVTTQPVGEVDDTALLKAQGYMQARGNIIAALQAIGAMPAELLDATVAYNRAALTEQRAAGAPLPILDALESEGRALKLAQRLRKDLEAIDESRHARDRITGGVPGIQGNGHPSV